MNKFYMAAVTAAICIPNAAALDIDIEQPGTLSDLIGEENKYTTTDLKIYGEINGTDILFIREMAGADINGDPTEGKLESLDLDMAWILEGGDPYFYSGIYGNLYTEDSYIGPYMFYGCAALKNFVMPYNVETIGMQAFIGCSIESFTFADGLKVIGPDAFQGCSLKELTLPDSVTEIWHNAFAYSPYLKTVYIGPKANKIDLPFVGCLMLENIDVNPDNLYYKSIDGVLFTSDGVLSQYPNAKSSIYTLPDETVGIGHYAFAYCDNIEEVTFSCSVDTVGQRAFNRCSGLKKVILNDSLCNIQPYAFYGCEALESADLPENLSVIGEYAFCDNAIREVALGDQLETVGNGAFADCPHLTKVTLPGNPDTELGQYVFFNSGITDIDFGGIDSIPGYTFCDNHNLTAIVIPESIKSIGEGAFCNCVALESIDFGSGVTSIGDNSLSGCLVLKEFIVPDQVISLGSGVTSNCTSLEKAVIGNGVTELGDYMFSWCSALTEASLGEGLTSTGVGTFTGCSALEKITLGSNINEIGDFCFGYCDALKNFKMPVTLAKIGMSAFSGAPFVEIHLPASLASIGSGAFSYCRDLASVVCDAVTPPVCGGNVFNRIAEKATLTVPEQSVHAYREAEEWKDFFSIGTGINAINCGASVETVGDMIVITTGGSYAVYTLDGCLIAQGKGNAVISVDAGIYIIRTSAKTIKALVK